MQFLEQAVTNSLVNLILVALFGTVVVTFGKSWWYGLLARIKDSFVDSFKEEIFRVEKKIDTHVVKCNEFPNSLIQEKLSNLEYKLDTNTKHTHEILMLITSRKRS